MKVNDILAHLTGEMQDRLSRVSPLMFLLDWVGKDRDEEVVNFSIAKARTQAWNFACDLAALREPDRPARIREVDEVITTLGGIILTPPSRLLRYTLKVIRYFEEKEVRRIVEGLKRDDTTPEGNVL